MEFRLLGPLEVLGAAGLVTIDRGKPLGLLEMLLLHAGEVVPTEQLIEALWAEEPPATAEHAVEVYVSRLRRALGNERIETRTPGYRLRLADGDLLDLDRFLALTGEAAAAMRDRRPAEATLALAQAEALWRGPALSADRVPGRRRSPGSTSSGCRRRSRGSTRGLPPARRTSSSPSWSGWSRHIRSASACAAS